MDKPTYEQGELQLKLYEARREPRLRQAREWFFRNYFVENLEDTMRIAAPGTENGTSVIMVLTYWDQLCAYLNHGLLHEGLLFETTGEFWAVYDRVKPILQPYREVMKNQKFMANLEQASQRFEKFVSSHSPEHLETMRQFTKQMRAQATSSARA